MASVSAIVKGVGRVFFPDTMTEKQIADSLAAKGQELLDMSTTARLSSAAPVAVGVGALSTGEEAEAGVLKSALSAIKKANPNVSLGVRETDSNIIIDKIVIPEEARGSGQGTKIMDELISIADKEGKTIGLTPSTDFGGSKAGLNRFYKRLGFVPNKGKNKDFSISESLVRAPVIAAAASPGFAAQVQDRQGETPTDIATRLLVRPGDKITAEETPRLEAVSDFLDKYGQTPVGPAFEGITAYLRDFGREDLTTKRRIKNAFMAALDLI